MSEYTNQELIENGERTRLIREKLNAVIDFANELSDADTLRIVGSYSTIEESVDTLTESVDLLAASYSFIEESVDTLTESVDLLAGSYSFIEESVDTLTESVDLLAASYSFIEESVDTLTESVDLLAASYSFIENDIDILYGSVSTLFDDRSDYIKNNPVGVTYSSIINFIVSMTQAQYDALVTKDVNTLYIIV